MNYYYLIASLPELSLEDPLHSINVTETLQFIKRNLREEDQHLSNYLIYVNDNQNLVNLILEKYHQIPPPQFSTPSIFSEEEINDFQKSKENFPEYIRNYLTKYTEKLDLLRPGRIEEYLWMEFYDEVSTLDNEFIIKYFQFDKILRQLAATHNSNIFEVTLISEFVSDVINRELEINRPSSVLSKIYPFVPELWSSLESLNPLKIGKCMDSIRWDYIDNYELTNTFSNNHVFGWIIKLIHYSRWLNLSEKKGLSRCEQLCDEAIQASGISELEIL